MEMPITQLPPGDPRLVEAIVGQLKSKGIFDQFRKECLADVDTKPAFQNLRLRVEGQVNKFLEKKIWKNDMNKNQLRDGVRKHVNSLGILDTGIDAIITQVVNPKIKPLILPYVEDTVYAFLQIDKPKRGRSDSELEISPVPCKEEEEEEMEEKKIKTEEIPETKPPLLPMETDVISSEEDDILARESPDGDKKSSSSSESDVAIDENARDGFEDSPEYQENTPEDITTNVERLNLSEDDSKSPQAAKPQLPLFDDQSLDSISSNSSGLTFSPLTDKGSPESKKSLENTPKSEDNLKADARSATSTPLVDEKPMDESSQSSLASDPSKEFASSEKIYPTHKLLEGEPETSTPSQSANTSIVRSAKEGESAMSVDEEDSRESKESFSKASQASEKSEVKSEVEEKAKSEKSEGEISSSGSELSDVEGKSKPETSHSDEKNHSDYDSSHKSRSKSDHKRRHDSYSRDRDREKDKDSRHHRDKERKHSKSRDDHHSHRDKDKKYHRRDKDHDGDKDRSRSHHHQSSSSSHKESSGSSRNSGDRDKDRSSHHSGGKSSEGKSRSKQSGEKTEAKSGSKNDSKADDKVQGKLHVKDDGKHDRRHSDRRSDSKHDGKRDKRSEERTKDNSDGRHDKTEGKPESKPKKKTEEIDDKFDGKSHKSGRASSSSRHKRTDSSGQNNDSKKHKHSHKSKTDETETLNGEMCNTEAENVPSENLERKEAVQNGESTINAAHMLGFDNDNIIVEDEEGNLMLLTYDDDAESVSSECPTKVKSEDSSCSETLPTEKEVLDPHDFEGFEDAKGDRRLADYLLTVEKVPDEMDMECSELLFDESDLHITLHEDAIKEGTALSHFLKCMQQLGAVIKNENGEVEEHSAKPIDSTDTKEKELFQIGKKRRISNSSSISSSSSSNGSRKHKRYCRESSTASETSQMLEQDSVIVSGYALLTPEDDGNRSMGREYDLDYSQKISNYTPLSPVSDSSADEGKTKNTGTTLKPSVGDTKASSEMDHKTEMWASEEAKLSV